MRILRFTGTIKSFGLKMLREQMEKPREQHGREGMKLAHALNVLLTNG